MSISGSEPESASDENANPPYTQTQVALSEWVTEKKRAWNAFHNATEGDEVIFGQRVQPLEVVNKEMKDGLVNLEVEGPRGGSYTVKERYKPDGSPRYYADDSKALNLRLIDAEEDSETPFTEYMYETLVENLKRSSVTTYAERDYENYEAAVRDVVNSWVSDVEFQRWRGWPYDWEDDDAAYIFRMIREHSGRMPDVDEGEVVEESEVGTTTPKGQATKILRDVVYERGRELAHEQLITSQDDYDAIVLTLADDAVERSGLKAYEDPRESSLAVAEEFVEAHTDPVHRAIIKYGDDDFIEYDLYDNLDPEEMTAEMAVDVLDQQVWAAARAQHKENETHDPTVRGLAFWEYDELVEKMVEDTLREHRLSDNSLLYTTAQSEAKEFAEMVSNERWSYDFGGVDEETWGAGDTDDIFTSIVMHSDYEPNVFNPFANDKEKKMAVQVLAEEVHDRASTAMDSSELRKADPVPAQEYLDEKLDIEMSFSEIRDDSGVSPEAFIRSAMEALENKDIDRLAGWTFIDELVEEGDANVPYNAGPWVLVDYGLVHVDDKERRAAWFNRDTGNVVQLEGTITNPIGDGNGKQQGYGYNDDFSVVLVKWNDNEPQYLTTDQSITFAFDFVRDFVGADDVDVQVIETPEGEHYIRDAITEDDVDTRAISDIAPDFSTPGPGFSVDDAFVYGEAKFKDLSSFLRRNSRIVDALAKTAVTLYLGQIAHVMYDKAPGLNIQPTYDKQKGLGIRGGYDFGAQGEDREDYDPDEDTEFFTGSVSGDVYVTPGTFKFIGSTVTPKWLYQQRDTTVLNTLTKKVEQPLRRGTNDYFRRERAVFIGVHLPDDAMGKPGTSDTYDQDNPETVEIAGATYTPMYQLDDGASHEGTKLRDLLGRLARHGYEVPTGRNGYVWGGDSTLADAMNWSESEWGNRRDDDGDAVTRGEGNLKPDEVHELGWSLERDMVIGSVEDGNRYIGTTEEVADPDKSQVVCTYRAFLAIYDEFTNTPNSTILSEAWEFYKARAEDADEFTLVDAYDRFRMGLVYDMADGALQEETRRVLQQAAAGNGVDPQNGRDISLTSHFTEGNDSYYVWQLDGEFDPKNVFPAEDVDEVGAHILFPKNSTPSDSIRYHYIDGSRSDGGENRPEAYRVNIPGGSNKQAQRATEMVNSPRRTLNNFSDLYSALLGRIQNDIAERVQDSTGIQKRDEEFDPADPVPEEERKRIQQETPERLKRIASGNIRWSDLEGTDKSIFGLFFRGLNTEDAVRVSNRWNLKDRFSTKLSDVLPRNYKPEKRDLPSFGVWLNRRQDETAIGSASERARQKARYFREVAEKIPGVQSGEAMGTDPSVEEQIELQRDVRDHHEDTDYTDYEQFYGEEFGEAFDDVARKFNNQRPEQMPESASPDALDSEIDEDNDQPNQS